MPITDTRLSPEHIEQLEDDIHHWTCCSEDVAMCGVDVTDEEWVPSDDETSLCLLCREVFENDLPCPVPGCVPCTCGCGS